MNGEQTLNYKSECQRETTNLTETIVTDICNGKVQHVPNGSIDIAGTLLVGILLIVVVVACITFTVAAIRDSF